MPNKKITQLTELTTPAYVDLLAIVDDPSGSPVTMKTTLLNLLGGPKPTSPSSYDDEFDSGTLNAKWTASNCASGTVDLLNVAAAKDCYDVATYPGKIALQPGQDSTAAGLEAEAAILRQTVSLATNCKIIAKLNLAYTVPQSPYNSAQAGLLLSGANGFDDDNFILCRNIPDSYTFNGLFEIAGAGNNILSTRLNGIQYLMILKTGNDFSIWGSTDGLSWGAGAYRGAAPDTVKITFGAGVMVRLSAYCYIDQDSEPNIPNPIAVFDWIRYFENNTPLVYA